MNSSLFYQCSVCREAFFKNTQARARHQAFCLAVADFYTSPGDEAASRPPAKKRQPSPAVEPPPVKKPRQPKKPPPLLQRKIVRGLPTVLDYVIENTGNFYKDNGPFLAAAKPEVRDILRDELKSVPSVRYQLVLESQYIHPEGMVSMRNFKTCCEDLDEDCSDERLEADLQAACEKLLAEEDASAEKKSGWSLHRVYKLTLRVTRLPAGSAYIPTPTELLKKKALLNVENGDDLCFKYAVLAKHLPGASHDSQFSEVDFRPLENVYNFSGLHFPLRVEDVDLFEADNPTCSVNVYQLLDDEEKIEPLRLAEEEKADHTDLLLLRQGTAAHYVYITDYERLIRKQLARNRNRLVVCKKCNSYVRRQGVDPEKWLREHTCDLLPTSSGAHSDVSTYIPTPTKLRKRKALVNVENRDSFSFKYAVLTKHLPNVSCDSRITEADFSLLDNIYDFSGLDFPLRVKDVRRFETNNPRCSVNVFELREGKVLPLRVVRQENADHTDLLLLRDEEGSGHYVYIADYERLMRPQLVKTTNKIVICKRCNHFAQQRRAKPSPEEWLQDHLRYCGSYKPTEIVMPSEERKQLKFTCYEQQIPVPIVVVADFEASLCPVDSEIEGGDYQRHKANSFCTLVHSTLDEATLAEADISTHPYLRRSDNAAADFLLHISELARKVEKLYTKNLPMRAMTADERERFENTTCCDLCEIPFNDNVLNCKKVADHQHIDGSPRHVLCGTCNLRARIPNFVPVYFHNLAYDEAFIVKQLGVLQGCEVKVIPSNSEKFISFSLKIGRIWLRFLDSYRLMADSLSNLADNLPVEELIYSSRLVPPSQIELIRRKGCYPYDYVTSAEKFQDTSLPPRSAFYSRLNAVEVSEADYAHAQKVWRDLNMSTFGQFHDFYLRLDVCLLMDVLQSFRAKCLRSYKIDCCHHFTAPGLAWQSMLRMSAVQLELLTDYDMFLLFESAIRGGLVQCCKRYARANHGMLERAEDFVADEPLSYLLYLDCVNLYGFAMSGHLPSGNFKWVDEADAFYGWINLPADSPTGYILECDVQIPQRLHDYFNDMPPLAENAEPPGGRQKKLLATLHDKRRYVAHYGVFQQAIRLGMKVTRVYKAISFSQSRWMKKFIDFNADCRAKASDAFSKKFYKFMNNSVYGKTLENVRNRVDLKLVTTDEALSKLQKSNRVVERTIIAEGVVAVRLARKKTVLDRPIYVGQVTLDLSKIRMYSFHYDVMTKLFARPEYQIDMCYMDTDGIIYHIVQSSTASPPVMVTLEKAAEHLDKTVCPSAENVNRIGTFKDQCEGRPMYEYIGLRSKMYAYRFSSVSSAQKKAKGIKSSFVDQHITFEQYKQALFEKKTFRANFNLIRCKSFDITTRTVEKASLCADDDKRLILDCNVRTLAHGHCAEERSSSSES